MVKTQVREVRGNEKLRLEIELRGRAVQIGLNQMLANVEICWDDMFASNRVLEQVLQDGFSPS